MNVDGLRSRSLSNMQCKCTIPKGESGYCERHKCEKIRRLVELCKLGAEGIEPGIAYWIAWEARRGPGQPKDPLSREQEQGPGQPHVEQPPGKTEKQSRTSGPGTELKRLFRWAGIQDTGCGGCGGMAARMDRWGPVKCREHLDEIVDHLEKQAAKRKLPFSRFAATKLVRLAIWKVERKANV